MGMMRCSRWIRSWDCTSGKPILIQVEKLEIVVLSELLNPYILESSPMKP